MGSLKFVLKNTDQTFTLHNTSNKEFEKIKLLVARSGGMGWMQGDNYAIKMDSIIFMNYIEDK